MCLYYAFVEIIWKPVSKLFPFKCESDHLKMILRSIFRDGVNDAISEWKLSGEDVKVTRGGVVIIFNAGLLGMVGAVIH
ncbi:hypothetical protein SAMN04488244_13212 [Vibrio hangzhouensis]|uniref:Uncharacterized protein n=1 Tax=Vibrio hangzhouensis TaxID=462991 RepID=A0A1H6C6J1_9VIBR|nr:hypothetical protein SAMN04488244_13212 [Vibrio hangzhouensis]